MDWAQQLQGQLSSACRSALGRSWRHFCFVLSVSDSSVALQTGESNQCCATRPGDPSKINSAHYSSPTTQTLVIMEPPGFQSLCATHSLFGWPLWRVVLDSRSIPGRISRLEDICSRMISCNLNLWLKRGVAWASALTRPPCSAHRETGETASWNQQFLCARQPYCVNAARRVID